MTGKENGLDELIQSLKAPCQEKSATTLDVVWLMFNAKAFM